MAWPVSAAFAADIIRPGHVPLFRIDILDAGNVVASSEVATPGVDLQVASGSVEVTRRNQVRRSGSLELRDTEGVLDALASGSLLDPLSGREFRLWRGLRILNDDLTTTDELVPLGTFLIEQGRVDETKQGVTISLTGRDRMAHLLKPWRAPFEVSDGTALLGEAFEAIVTEILGTVTTATSPSADVVPEMAFGGDGRSTPAADLAKLVAGGGMQALMDPMGTPTMRPIPDPADAPVAWTHSLDGTGRLTSVRHDVDRSTLRNGVIVRGEAQWLLFPVSGEAWDTDPTSPTYYDPDETDPVLVALMIGPFPEEVRDAVVGSDVQAAAAAAARLPQVLGVEEQVDLSMVPLPQLDADDIVEAEAYSLGGTLRLVADTLTVPLDYGTPMTVGSVRRRQ